MPVLVAACLIAIGLEWTLAARKSRARGAAVEKSMLELFIRM
jgi:hypothetical protein